MDAIITDPLAVRYRALRESHGFIIKADLVTLAANDQSRLWPLLVRCGGCRFTAPAQDVAVLIAAIEASGDYVRDVSFPAEVSR